LSIFGRWASRGKAIPYLYFISPIHTFVNIPALIRKRSVFLSSRAGILTKVWIGDIQGGSKWPKIDIFSLSGYFFRKYDIDVNSSTIKNKKVNSIIFFMKILRENRQNEYISFEKYFEERKIRLRTRISAFFQKKNLYSQKIEIFHFLAFHCQVGSANPYLY
jgi:hypothetical protein